MGENFVKVGDTIVNLGEDGIIRTVGRRDTEASLEYAKAIIAAILKVSGGRRVPNLVDLRGVRNSISRDARIYFAGAEADRALTATAMVVDSSLGRMIGNFYLGLNQPKRPTRLFTQESEAVEWLKNFLNQHG